MKDRKRAIRRHHRERMLKKRYKQVKTWNWHKPTEEFFRQETRYRLHTPCRCSCPMCGNPRKFLNEKTLDEVRNEISYEEFLKDET